MYNVIIIHESILIINPELHEKTTTTSTAFFNDIVPIQQFNMHHMNSTTKTQSKLNKEWTQFFQQALHPRKLQHNHNIQLAHQNRHPTLSRQDNKPMGDTFYKENENEQIWNVNANTILTHNNYAELNKLCLSIAEYNFSIVGLQEINLDLDLHWKWG